jgi:hypothetical protein
MSRVGVLLNAFQYPINSRSCFSGNGVGDNEMGMVVEERYLTLQISVDRVVKRIRHTRPLFYLLKHSSQMDCRELKYLQCYGVISTLLPC